MKPLTSKDKDLMILGSLFIFLLILMCYIVQIGQRPTIVINGVKYYADGDTTEIAPTINKRIIKHEGRQDSVIIDGNLYVNGNLIDRTPN